MDFLKGNIYKIFIKFLFPAVSSAIAVAAYSLIDTITIEQCVGAEGTAACVFNRQLYRAIMRNWRLRIKQLCAERVIPLSFSCINGRKQNLAGGFLFGSCNNDYQLGIFNYST